MEASVSHLGIDSLMDAQCPELVTSRPSFSKQFFEKRKKIFFSNLLVKNFRKKFEKSKKMLAVTFLPNFLLFQGRLRYRNTF